MASSSCVSAQQYVATYAPVLLSLQVQVAHEMAEDMVLSLLGSPFKGDSLREWAEAHRVASQFVDHLLDRYLHVETIPRALLFAARTPRAY
jgi:hypothetical protein